MSGPALLDVNVLIALFDPEHIHHDTSHTWFGGQGRGQWATCPTTENGLVRVVSNPAYPGRRTTVREAARLLTVFCQHPDHVFWHDSVTLRDAGEVRLASIQGHRQVTDAYLLALAVSNRGALATFDRSMPLSAVPKASAEHLVQLGV